MVKFASADPVFAKGVKALSEEAQRNLVENGLSDPGVLDAYLRDPGTELEEFAGAGRRGETRGSFGHKPREQLAVSGLSSRAVGWTSLHAGTKREKPKHERMKNRARTSYSGGSTALALPPSAVSSRPEHPAGGRQPSQKAEEEERQR